MQLSFLGNPYTPHRSAVSTTAVPFKGQFLGRASEMASEAAEMPETAQVLKYRGTSYRSR